MAAPRPKGNTRTGQDKEFTAWDKTQQTREIHDKHEKEADAKDAATVAPDAGGMDVMERAQRMGRTMTTAELTAKLQAINPNFVVRVSKSDATKCGIYLPEYVQNVTGGWTRDLVHIMGCENTGHPLTGGIMPEFSIIEGIDETVPGPGGELKKKTFKAETRGWRTVVAMLLIRRIITIADVEKHFGVIPSKDSARWHELAMSPLELSGITQVQTGATIQ